MNTEFQPLTKKKKLCECLPLDHEVISNIYKMIIKELTFS